MVGNETQFGAIFGTMKLGVSHQGSRAATEDLSHPIGFGLSVAGPGTGLFKGLKTHLWGLDS